MSRFFEALKQAGQSFPLPGDAGSSTEAEAPKSTTPARDAGSGLDLELHAQFQAAFPPETNEAPAASLQQSTVLETEPAILAQAEPAVTAPSVPEITPDDIKPALAQPPLSENGNHTNGHFGRS